MKKWIVRIIVALLVIGAFAGVGMVSYRIGYQQGVQGTNAGMPALFGHAERFNQNPLFRRDTMPQFHPGFSDDFNHRSMPVFGNSRFTVMNHGSNFGFFSPFRFLFNIALLGLVIWLGYKLFKGNGWQLSLTRQPTSEMKPEASKDATGSDG